MKLNRLLLVAFTCVSMVDARASEPVRFEPAVATLTGLISYEYRVSPYRDPALGTTLVLDGPITIEGNPESKKAKRAKRDVVKILLEPVSEDVDLKSLTGQRATVQGRLFREYSTSFETDVTMRVEAVIDSAMELQPAD